MYTMEKHELCGVTPELPIAVKEVVSKVKVNFAIIFLYFNCISLTFG